MKAENQCGDRWSGSVENRFMNVNNQVVDTDHDGRMVSHCLIFNDISRLRLIVVCTILRSILLLFFFLLPRSPPLFLHLESVLQIFLSSLLSVSQNLLPCFTDLSPASSSETLRYKKVQNLQAASKIFGLLFLDYSMVRKIIWTVFYNLPRPRGWTASSRDCWMLTCWGIWTYLTSLFWTKKDSNLDLRPMASVNNTFSIMMFMKPSEWTIWKNYYNKIFDSF